MTENARARGGFRTITPYLVVRDVAWMVEFLASVFGAQERGNRMLRGDGDVLHTEVQIGDSVLILGEPGVESLEESTAVLYVYVDDTDRAYQRAIALGATSLRAPVNEFWGDRDAGVRDPFGNQWWMYMHVEDVPQEDLRRRASAV